VKSWSVSSIRSFHGCQLAWWFRRTGVKEDFKPLALVEGIVLHEAIAETLRALRQGAAFPEEDAVALLRATFFAHETGVPIRYGEKSREDVLSRLEALYRHWRATFQPGGEIVAVEEEVRAEFEGVDLPMVGYVDLVVRTSEGDRVVDFKVTAAKPTPDPLLDRVDLQKLALTRAWEIQSGKTVTSWRWSHLVKTKAPACVDLHLPVAENDREGDLARLAVTVNSTLRVMDAVIAGKIEPVPTQAAFAMCGTCPWRTTCAACYREPRRMLTAT
jgi:hypothetical protein